MTSKNMTLTFILKNNTTSPVVWIETGNNLVNLRDGYKVSSNKIFTVWVSLMQVSSRNMLPLQVEMWYVIAPNLQNCWSSQTNKWKRNNICCLFLFLILLGLVLNSWIALLLGRPRWFAWIYWEKDQGVRPHGYSCGWRCWSGLNCTRYEFKRYQRCFW